MAKKQTLKPAMTPSLSKARGGAKRIAGTKTKVSAKPSGATKFGGKSNSATRGTIGAVTKPAGGKQTKMSGGASPSLGAGSGNVAKAKATRIQGGGY